MRADRRTLEDGAEPTPTGALVGLMDRHDGQPGDEARWTAGSHPAVRFGAARRPEDATEIALTEWSGPLGLLLSLIEARRLDVLTVPLGALASAYLDALASLDGDRILNVSSFVAIASQLILIKSRAILPRHPTGALPDASGQEEPDPEAALRDRLILYRAYRDAGLLLQDGPGRHPGLFRREPSAALADAVLGARPADAGSLDPELLASALRRLAVVAPLPEAPPEVMRRSVTLTQRAAILRAALRDAPSVVLQELLAGVHDRVVVAVTFLAMLELIKRREIVVEQAMPFGPITARRSTESERMAGGGTGPGSHSPLDESMDGFR